MWNKHNIQFILRHYRPKVFSPDQALERFWGREGSGTVEKRTTVIWWWALVTMFVVTITIGTTLHQRSMDRWEMVTAPVAELPDGSVVQLKEGASLAYQPHRFSRERTVRLSGTGCFDVVHDPDAPFEVHTEEAYVRVLGTRFLFDADEGEVYVIEGRVRFSRVSTEEGVVLAKGEHAFLSAGAGAPVLEAPELPNPAAWATGRLAYESVPLGTVLEELSSIYGSQLSVAPETAIGKRLTGDFLLDDGLDFIATAIEAALDVQIARSDEKDE